MTSADDPRLTPATNHRMARIAAASTIGTIIEWYDYLLFATASAVIFPHLFFPEFSAAAGTLASFATFFAAFAARPVGAAVFGHFGDRAGRKATLLITLSMMAISTVVIGVIPPYSAFGVAAPILLVASRVAQGIALGGEWGGSVLLAIEHGPENKRGFFGSLPQVGTPVGTLASAGAVALFGLVTGVAFTSWGWRIPFLLSVLLAAVGLFIRVRISETPEFARAEAEGRILRQPLLTVLHAHWGRVLLGMGTRIGTDVAYYVFVTYSLSYLASHVTGVGHETGLVAVLVASALEMATIPVFGRLSDRTGRKPLLLAGIGFLGIWAFPLFWMLTTGSAVLIVLGIAIGMAIGHGLAWSIMGVFFPELFDANIRYTGSSLAFQFAGIFGGGPAPFIATLIAATAVGWPGVAGYVLAACLISFVCCAAIPETRKRAVPRPVTSAVAE